MRSDHLKNTIRCTRCSYNVKRNQKLDYLSNALRNIDYTCVEVDKAMAIFNTIESNPNSDHLLAQIKQLNIKDNKV